MAKPERWRLIGGPGDLLYLLGGVARKLESDYPSLIPDITAGTKLVLASDYAGQHDLATYKAYSFVLADVDSSVAWDTARSEFRRDHLADMRRVMSFKSLADIARWRVLPAFLQAADQIVGVVATFLVDRQFETLLPPAANAQIEALLPPGLTPPKPAVLEEMIRIAHFIVLLLAGLARDGQGVQWITDRDPIVEDEVRQSQMIAVISAVAGAYADEVPRLSYFRAGSTESPDPIRIIEDFASIPDLAAGALASVFEHNPELATGIRAGLIVSPSDNTPEKVSALWAWLARRRVPLKRITFVLDAPDDSRPGLWVHLLRIHGPDDDPSPVIPGAPVT